MAPIYVVNHFLNVFRVVDKNKGVATCKPVFVSCHLDVFNSIRSMRSYQIFDFFQSSIVRHVHQVYSALNDCRLVASWFKTTLLKKWCDLANEVVDRPVVEMLDALLCRLFGSLKGGSRV